MWPLASIWAMLLQTTLLWVLWQSCMLTPEKFLMYVLEPWIKGILKPFYWEIISDLYQSYKKVKRTLSLYPKSPIANLHSFLLCAPSFPWALLLPMLCVCVPLPNHLRICILIFYLNYFSVYLLRIRTFCYITTIVQLPTSGNLTLIQYFNVLSIFHFCQFFFSSTGSSLGSPVAFSYYVSVSPFDLEQFFRVLFLFFVFFDIDILEEHSSPSLIGCSAFGVYLKFRLIIPSWILHKWYWMLCLS